MKEQFRNKLKNAPVKRFIRKVLHKVHRRFHAFFYYDESLFLKDLDRHKRWEIGEYTYGHPSKSPRIVHFGEDCKLKIGNYCSFAENVWIVFGGFHRTDWITTYPFSVLFDGAEDIEGLPHAKGDIVIGNDVWVCTGAMIMSGVAIGNGAVIAAGSVVTKDVPPYTVVAGNPALPVKKRFPDEIIEELEKIQWWTWPIEKIKEELPTLLSHDVQKFLSKHSETMDLEEILR